METCSLCETNRFCAVLTHTADGIPVRCTREPNHSGEHAACGERDDEHPIHSWAPELGKKRSRYRARTKRVN